MMVVRSTATATRGNQQLSLLEICDDSLFAQTKMRGGGDGRLSFARVPCPLLPFFLVILLPLLPLPPAAQLQVVGLGRQVLLAGASGLVEDIDRQGGASLGRLSWVVASLRPWSCSRPWARSRALRYLPAQSTCT